MFANFLFRIYRFCGARMQERIRGLLLRMEGGITHSRTIRRIFREHYQIDVGMYTHGSVFDLYMIDPHTRIGRYCSLAKGVRILNHNHDISFKSTSPVFVRPEFGHSKEWIVDFTPLEIGNDVWIGANAIILPEVKKIGDGAVIGGGAVVNKDVPPYAIILGNPGRVIKYRFSEQKIQELLAERWWDKDLEELSKDVEAFQKPLEDGASTEAERS